MIESKRPQSQTVPMLDLLQKSLDKRKNGQTSSVLGQPQLTDPLQFSQNVEVIQHGICRLDSVVLLLAHNVQKLTAVAVLLPYGAVDDRRSLQFRALTGSGKQS